MTAVVPDPFDVRLALQAPELLRAFNKAGVLSAADVHVACRLAKLAGGDDDAVLLAAALAVRAPRSGHVHVDLASIRDTAAVDAEEAVDLSELPWPQVEEWIDAVRGSELVAAGEEALLTRPLRLIDSRLYLDRYWQEERRVAADLLAIAGQTTGDVSLAVLKEGLARLFAGELAGRQAIAAATAVLRRLAVIAGGPGTGKTTTVARVVALLAEQAAAAGAPTPLIALAAPTGKAAARLEEAVHEEAARLPVDDGVRAQLLGLRASTLHRLLGWRPGSSSRFRHHRGERLAHDVVIVDETSMVSLSLMARLAEAIRPDARLILVGDPGQLTSIEAGAVLGDVVGPAADDLVMSDAARAALADVTGSAVVEATAVASDGPVGDGIVVLDQIYRFGGGIGRLADAIRRGDGDGAIEALLGSPEDVVWIAEDAGAQTDAGSAVAALRAGALGAARAVAEAAREGDGAAAIARLGSYRLLCAHRRGAHGVATWNARIETWMAAEVGGARPDGPWYVGRPLLVNDNDYELGLFNGDTGVIVQAGVDRLAAAFERRGEVVEVSTSRLGVVETVYAMTIHKSQGSQFDTAAVLLPAADSRILTRELLYTAVTRARKRLVVVGAEEMVRAAVARPVARASGLRGRLWT